MAVMDFLLKLFAGPPEYVFDFNQAKKRCRIALVDDDATALPLEELLSDNYSIEQYFSVDAMVLQRLEDGDFDIIILDYNGIAPQAICPDDGFGVFDLSPEIPSRFG